MQLSLPHTNKISTEFHKENPEEVRVLFTQLEQQIDILKDRLHIVECIKIKKSNRPNDLIFENSRTVFKKGLEITVNLKHFTFLDEGTQEFALLHELSHIKNKDGNNRFFVQLSGLAFLIIAPPILATPSTATGLALLGTLYVVNRMWNSVFSMFMEVRADKQAFLSCSELGRERALSFFERFASHDSSLNLWNKVCLYAIPFLLPSGGLQHPPSKFRAWSLRKLFHHPVFPHTS